MELAIAIAANILIGGILLALFAWRRAPDVARLAGPDEALAIYGRQFPETASSVTLASDGLAALVSLSTESKIGLIHRHGRRWTARQLLPEDLRSVTVHNETITVSLADFGWPSSHVLIADPQMRQDWFARLQGFAAKNYNERSR
jgi:hypothetical protein